MPIRTVSLRDTARCAHWSRRGSEYLALGENALALEAFRAALLADPDDDGVRATLARLEHEAGDPARAAALAVEAIGRRPAHPEALNLLGVLLHAAGDRDLAGECWRRALALAAGFKVAQRNLRRGRTHGRGRAAVPLLDAAALAEILEPKRQRLSVCLIARDEAEMLPACLESVAAVADQIVVVDTGSTDATAAIAQRAGASVASFEWRDDFSAARNEALRHARGDWILFIDADERLVSEDAPALRAAIEEGRFDYASIAIESLVDGDKLATRGVRLYRNYPGLRFTGRVHEQILPALRELEARVPLRRAESQIRLVHLGYERARFAARDKERRNSALMDLELRERNDNAYVLLKSGAAQFARGNFDAAKGPIGEALAATRAALEAGNADASVLEEPATLFAACLVAQGAAEQALATLADLHRWIRPTANTLYLEGVALWALGREGARRKLMAALEAPDGAGELFTFPEVRGATPALLLGRLALSEGDSATAKHWFERALACEPEHREARLGLAETRFHEGNPAGAVAVLSATLAADPGDLRSWQAGAVYLAASPGQDAAARAWLDAARSRFPVDGVLDRVFADLESRG